MAEARRTTVIRDADKNDFGAILSLNQESVHFTSAMDTARLAHLHAQSAYHRVVELDGEVVAFLLALGEGADYPNPNYDWFSAHLHGFLYVDRIVISAVQQGKRLGQALYDDLFAYASQQGIGRIACEFDVEPPNPVSQKFHARYGFKEVGTHWVAGGSKRVSLQVAEPGT
ncbi:MAG: GNAT family N-acetyltransferase [Pseudoxanthomonas sp.]